MATYIIAIMLEDFECISTTVPNNITSNHALAVAKKSLAFYIELFQCPYALPKLHLVAIPDFDYSAMEIWGLVTFRETALLIDPENASLLSRQNVVLTVAHEVSHMWFGNLVTMSWWTDLWLKEGLTLDDLPLILLSDGMKAYFGKFKYSNATTEDLCTVLQATSGCGVTEFMPLWTKQTGYPVLSVRLIRAPDGKCSVGLKQQRFLAGGSSTNGKRLFLGICFRTCTITKSDVAMVEPHVLALRWTTKYGSVKLDNVHVKVNASHFAFNVHRRTATTLVHPNYRRAVEDYERLLLHKVVDIPSSASNPREPNAVGFYRVLYKPVIMNTIIEAISSGTVSERDRITLLDDQFAVARAGFLRLDEVLQFCRAFVKETRHRVWLVLSDRLAQVRTLLGEATYPVGDKVVFLEASKEICGLNKLCNELALPVYEKIGFEPTSTDSNNDRLLRPIIISTLGRIGHADVICRAQTAFRRHYAAVISAPGDDDAANQSERISPDLRAAIYSICMRNGGVEVFGKLLEVCHHISGFIMQVSCGRVLAIAFTERMLAELTSCVVWLEEWGLEEVRRNQERIVGRNEQGQRLPLLLYQLLTQSIMNDERVRILSSLGATTNADIIGRIFDFTFTECVRKQDRFHLLLGVTESPGGRRALWKLVRDRFSTLSEDLSTSHLLARVLKGSAAAFASEERCSKTFFEEHDVPCPRVIQQTLESVKINAEQWKRDIEVQEPFGKGAYRGVTMGHNGGSNLSQQYAANPVAEIGDFSASMSVSSKV
ncbi:unnamed protein product [Taenia asiatica]|uniref:Aminopeptidase n=1 Tax=Taenia asiatica TaxID=60517 RepID=A0A0R3VX08_TAEAS|nr:unnamed protein product [Taenia asiatica]